MVASGEMNLTNYKEWMKAIESELKSTRATTGSDVAVQLFCGLYSIFHKRLQVLNWLSRQNLIVVLRQDRLFSDGCKSMVLIVETRLSADLIY